MYSFTEFLQQLCETGINSSLSFLKTRKLRFRPISSRSWNKVTGSRKEPVLPDTKMYVLKDYEILNQMPTEANYICNISIKEKIHLSHGIQITSNQ